MMHAAVRCNLYECVLAAGALLGRADEAGDELGALVADAERIADVLAPVDPLAALIVRGGVARVLDPPTGVGA